VLTSCDDRADALIAFAYAGTGLLIVSILA
jgi:hypothetical protein